MDNSGLNVFALRMLIHIKANYSDLSVIYVFLIFCALVNVYLSLFFAVRIHLKENAELTSAIEG